MSKNRLLAAVVALLILGIVSFQLFSYKSSKSSQPVPDSKELLAGSSEKIEHELPVDGDVFKLKSKPTSADPRSAERAASRNFDTAISLGNKSPSQNSIPPEAAFSRFDVHSQEHVNWLIRNKYAEDAHQAMLAAADISSLRLLAAEGDLAAQVELADRLDRTAETQFEAAELRRDAALKGSREAFMSTAESFEQSGVCSNSVQLSAYLQVAILLGDLSAMPKYVSCAHQMSPQDHGFSIVLAAKIFSELNAESLQRFGHPLQPDLHPMTDVVIDNFARGAIEDAGD